jgi:hypothetical protein
MAEQNPGWGYTSLVDRLRNLGHKVGRTAVAEILKSNGLEPATQRRRRTSWRTFIGAHWSTFGGLLLVMDLATRRVELAGTTIGAGSEWMKQVARNLTDAVDGFLVGKRFVLMDRDAALGARGLLARGARRRDRIARRVRKGSQLWRRFKVHYTPDMPAGSTRPNLRPASSHGNASAEGAWPSTTTCRRRSNFRTGRVPDDLDDCPTTYDPDQQSAEGDGIGDACEARDGGNPDLTAPPDVAAPTPPDLTAPPDLRVLSPVVLHGVASAVLASNVITINRPTGTNAGDALVAVMVVGNVNATAQPTVTPPSGFTLVDRIDVGLTASLLVYLRMAGSTEPSAYTWAPSDVQDSGVGWIAAYSGVDPVSPIDAHVGQATPTTGTTCTTPKLTTSTSTMLVVSFVGQSAGMANTWTVPSGLTQLVNLNNNNRRSGLGAATFVPSAGQVGPFSSTASISEENCITNLIALKAR